MKTLLVIFGVTGDLARRKLLPALDAIVKTGDEDLSILGVSRQNVRREDVFDGYPRLLPQSDIFTMNLAEPREYQRLKAHLDTQPADKVLFYLSVPPGAAASIVDFLGEAGLNDSRYQVLFEKPFGYDVMSAREFIHRTARYYEESQLYRIDHYMAKEVAIELLKLRRNAENHHHHWSNESVKSVTIVASESIGVEGRGQFYEQTGALRDVIQGHLLQLLSLVLIPRPGSESLPAERLKALQHVQPANPSKAVRGQYAGYQDEVGNPGSHVETLASIELESTDPRWKGVPLRLITGKALSEKRTAVYVAYHDGSVDVFEEGAVQDSRAGRSLDAYERVLTEAIHQNEDIFTTSAEVERSWEIVAPVQLAWEMSNDSLLQYQPGMSLDELSAAS